MDLKFTADDDAFRAKAIEWLTEALEGDWAHVRFRGGPGDEHALVDERKAWGKHLGEAGWSCIDWPVEHGGLGATIMQQVVFNEEYARLGGPGRLGHIGETLAGPTIVHFGNEAQQKKFLPAIRLGQTIWAQGYSEPNAGSDLANVQTKAELVGDEWVITGQKTWTSHAHVADWCFVLCRTDTDAVKKHRGISYILVPMDQPGIDVRPIRQMTGTSEFNEVFFDGAKAHKDDVIGGVNNGWRVAMGTLAFERGASTLGQQMAFQSELDSIVALAKGNGAASDPIMRQRIAKAHMGLQIMRWTALRVLSDSLDGGELPRAAMINKLYWANWHRDLGELAMDVLGIDADVAEPGDYELTALQRMYLFSRSDTIYAGSNQIQRNIVSERALGMPRHK
ncbi:MAG: alkylation response protein AidB-like acyl-CoA dehydrogenase [Bradymonadia bacterium]|jgi:alkylation response protein AidB-like acyl-CoA dehydrogenase